MSRSAKMAAAALVLAVATVSLLRRRRQDADGSDAGGDDPESLVRSYYEALSDGDADAVKELLADGYCGHVHTLSGVDEQDADDLARRIEGHGDAFEHVDYEVEDAFGSDGEIAARVTMRTHHRETGRDAETTGLVILRVEKGRIAEEWSSWDYMGLAEQLGLAPNG